MLTVCPCYPPSSWWAKINEQIFLNNLFFFLCVSDIQGSVRVLFPHSLTDCRTVAWCLLVLRLVPSLKTIMSRNHCLEDAPRDASQPAEPRPNEQSSNEPFPQSGMWVKFTQWTRTDTFFAVKYQNWKGSINWHASTQKAPVLLTAYHYLPGRSTECRLFRRPHEVLTRYKINSRWGERPCLDSTKDQTSDNKSPTT